MLKQTGSTERDIKGRNIPLTPPPQLYSNVGLFFYVNTMIPLIYCLFLYNNVASSELIRATTRENGSKLLNRTGRVLYVYCIYIRICLTSHVRDSSHYVTVDMIMNVSIRAIHLLWTSD